MTMQSDLLSLKDFSISDDRKDRNEWVLYSPGRTRESNTELYVKTSFHFQKGKYQIRIQISKPLMQHLNSRRFKIYYSKTNPKEMILIKCPLGEENSYGATQSNGINAPYIISFRWNFPYTPKKENFSAKKIPFNLYNDGIILTLPD